VGTLSFRIFYQRLQPPTLSPGALREIAKTGFSGVEILADKPHAWLDGFSAADVSGLAQQLDKLGLFCLQH